MDNPLDIIASRAFAARDKETETMGADGFLHCTICGGKRQTSPYPGRTVFCFCPCQSERRDKLEQERKRREAMDRAERFCALGVSLNEIRGYTFSKDTRMSAELKDSLWTFIEDFQELHTEGRGLLLAGNVGTGKTFAAGCVLNELNLRGFMCCMTQPAHLVDQYSAYLNDPQKQESFLHTLCNYDLIVLDDFGSERQTEFVRERMTAIIDELYRNRVSLIVTTNYTVKQLSQENDLGKQRMFNRLLECCTPVDVSGVSLRIEKGRDNYRDFQRRIEERKQRRGA